MLEVARVSPVAFCTRALADLGASVIRVDAPPAAAVRQESWGTAGTDPRQLRGDSLNRGKKSIAVDLKTAAGVTAVRALAARSDVVVDGFRPGVLDRLGIGYDALAEVNPGLVYCAMTGYGQDSPYRDLPGHDLNYLGQSGMLNLFGRADEAPVLPLNLVADLGGGALHAIIGVLAALLRRERTGAGGFVDISYADAALSLFGGTVVLKEFLATGTAFTRGVGLFTGDYPYYAIYTAADGRQLTLACVEHRLWQNFCAAIGRADLTEAGPRRDDFMRRPGEAERQLKAELKELFGTKSAADWFAVLSRAGVPVGLVNDMADVASDEHYRQRGMWIDVGAGQPGTDEPETGQPAFGVSFREPAAQRPAPARAPGIGEHTGPVLAALGYAAEQVAELARQGVIYCQEYEDLP